MKNEDILTKRTDRIFNSLFGEFIPKSVLFISPIVTEAEVSTYIEKRRNKTGTLILDYDKYRLQFDKSNSRRSRFIIVPVGVELDYIKQERLNYGNSDVKIYWLHKILKSKINSSFTSWSIRVKELKIRQYLRIIISDLLTRNEYFTLIGFIKLNHEVVSILKEFDIEVMTYLTDPEVLSYDEANGSTHWPWFNTNFLQIENMHKFSLNNFRIITFNLMHFALHEDDVRQDYWALFNICGLLSEASGCTLITRSASELVNSMFRRLGFRFINVSDFPQKNIFGDVFVRNLDHFDVIQTSYVQSYNGFNKPVSMSFLGRGAFPDKPERFFGRFVRSKIWEFVTYLKRNLVTLGSEYESFNLQDELLHRPERVIHFTSLTKNELNYDWSSDILMTNDFVADKRVKSFTLSLNAILLGLFSVSNIRNPRPNIYVKEVSTFTQSYIFTFPNSNYCYYWKDGMYNINIDRKNGILKQISFKDEYQDWMASADDFNGIDGCNVMTMRDFIVMINTDNFGNIIKLPIDDSSDYDYSTDVDPGDIQFDLWLVVFGKDIYSEKYQTWKNSQTNYARYISIPLRNSYYLKENTLHDIRSYCLVSMYHDKSPVIIHDKRISGSIKINGKIIFISVSGHLINLLMYSTGNVIDFRRYMDTYLSNIKANKQNKLNRKELFLLKNNLLAENNSIDDYSDLWHSFYDLQIGVASYIMICKLIKMPLNIKAARYILIRLNQFKTYSNFMGECRDSLEYRRLNITAKSGLDPIQGKEVWSVK